MSMAASSIHLRSVHSRVWSNSGWAVLLLQMHVFRTMAFSKCVLFALTDGTSIGQTDMHGRELLKQWLYCWPVL